MAWRRLGTVAMQVTAASLAAAAARARDAPDHAPPGPPPAERPVLFTRVAVVAGPAEPRPGMKAVSAAA